MNNEAILNRILTDFIPENFANLNRSVSNGSFRSWYLYDKNSENIKYSLTYDLNGNTLLIGNYEDLVDKESKLKILSLLEKLDNEYDAIMDKKGEEAKMAYIAKILS